MDLQHDAAHIHVWDFFWTYQSLCFHPHQWNRDLLHYWGLRKILRDMISKQMRHVPNLYTFLFCWTQRWHFEECWQPNAGSHWLPLYFFPSNYLVSNILQNIIFCAQQKKHSQVWIGIKWGCINDKKLIENFNCFAFHVKLKSQTRFKKKKYIWHLISDRSLIQIRPKWTHWCTASSQRFSLRWELWHPVCEQRSGLFSCCL